MQGAFSQEKLPQDVALTSGDFFLSVETQFSLIRPQSIILKFDLNFVTLHAR